MDLIRWQRRSVFSFGFPSSGSLPLWRLCCAQPRRSGAQAHTSCQTYRDKKNGPTHKRRILTELVSGQMQRFGSHTSLSVVCRPLFFYVLYLKRKKMYSNKQEKKRFTNAKLQKKYFLGGVRIASCEPVCRAL